MTSDRGTAEHAGEAHAGSRIHAREVSLSHGLTHYLEAGEGEPVILLHGAGFELGGDCWSPTIPALAGRMRVLAPDFPGWGLGGQLEQGYSFAYLVDFVREFQDALGMTSSHVIGHSMGGWISSLLAYESPRRVGRLVLIASGGMATRRLHGMVGWQPPTEAIMRRVYAHHAALGVDIDALVGRKLELVGDELRVARFRNVMAHMSDPETRARYHMARRLPHLSSPTLIVWGDADEVNPVALAEATHELIPGSELRLFEGCGHAPHWQRADAVLPVIADFLSGLAPSGQSGLAPSGQSGHRHAPGNPALQEDQGAPQLQPQGSGARHEP